VRRVNVSRCGEEKCIANKGRCLHRLQLPLSDLRQIVPGFYVDNHKKMGEFFSADNGNGFDSDIMCIVV
jgi:hypothetical protein